MPLIIVVGRPCTGKTTFSQRLAEYLRRHLPAAAAADGVRGVAASQVQEPTVELINEESLNIDKRAGYSSSLDEKHTRSALKAVVTNKLTGACCVIVDSLNYIKGYRYELYCSARSLRTPHCVIWVGCQDSTSDEWNAERMARGADTYDINIFRDLRMRFEAPNEQNRWDCPLFKVAAIDEGPASDSPSHKSDEATSSNLTSDPVLPSVDNDDATLRAPISTVFKSSWRPNLKSRSVIKAASRDGDARSEAMDDVASISTRASRLDAAAPRVISFSGTDAAPSSSYSSLQGFQSVDQTLPAVLHYLQGAAAPVPNSSTITLQRATPALLYELDRVSQSVIERLVAHQAEAAVVVGTPLKFPEYDRAITLTHHVSQAELQRYRRQYVKVNGSHPPLSSQAIGTSFIDYLALHI